MKKEQGPFYLLVKGTPVKVDRRVYEESLWFDRRERYFSQELKQERIIFDPKKGTVQFVPPKESSLNQMIEEGFQFEEPPVGPLNREPAHSDLLELLDEALGSLTDEEWALVQELYYLGKTEREAGKRLKISKSTIHRRKEAILFKLKNFVERFF